MSEPTSTQKSISKTHVYAFDALRVFAILTVLLIHALMTGRDIGQSSAMASFDTWIHYAVPLFVFVSGALLWSRPWTAGSYGTFVKRRFLRIGPSYLFWSVVYIALLYLGQPGSGALYGVQYNWNGLSTGGVGILTNLVRLPGYLFSGHSWYHLYFIPMIFTFYLLTPLFARALHGKKCLPEITVIATLLIKMFVWPLLANGLELLDNPFITSYCTHIFQHLPAMALGGWFGMRMRPYLLRWSTYWTNRLEKPNALDAAGASTSSPIATVSTATTPALFTGSISKAFFTPLKSALYPFYQIALFVLPACLLEPLWIKIKKPLTAASQLSFGVYYIHPLFLLIAQRASLALINADNWNMFWTSWSGTWLVWGFLLLASYASCWLISKSSYFSWIIGLQKPRKPQNNSCEAPHVSPTPRQELQRSE